jgi:hypothetical protein
MKDNRTDFLEERQSEGNVLYQKKPSWRQKSRFKELKNRPSRVAHICTPKYSACGGSCYLGDRQENYSLRLAQGRRLQTLSKNT